MVRDADAAAVDSDHHAGLVSAVEEGEPRKVGRGDDSCRDTGEGEKGGANACVQKVWKILKKQDFLAGMLVMVLLASLWPEVGKKKGYLEAQYSLKYGVIPIVFLMSGIGLETSKLGIAIKSPSTHLFTQFYNFIAVSAVCYGVATFLEWAGVLSESLATGFVVMGTVPCTVSMCNIFTQQANGNTAISLVNSSVGNLLGILATPALVLMYVRVTGGVDIGKLLMTLALVLVLPFAVGQCLRRIKRVDWAKFKPYRKSINKVCLLLIVYASFCDLFSQPDAGLTVGDVFLVISICAVLYTSLVSLSFLVGRQLIPLRADLVASLYCGSHKTVAVGIPLLTIIFEDSDLVVGVLAFPLLIYHQIEMILGLLTLEKVGRWVAADPHPVAVREREGHKLIQEETKAADTTATTKGVGGALDEDGVPEQQPEEWGEREDVEFQAEVPSRGQNTFTSTKVFVAI
jgi:sodium/bile acid cotransporter 7